MDIKEIKEIIDAISASGYGYAKIKNKGTVIELSRECINTVPVDIGTGTPSHISTTTPVVSEEIQSSKVEEVVPAEEGLYIVKSPIVGTFYTASSPDAEPYVKKGDKVKKGDTLCIIEAMKLMNEIDVEVSGEIMEILVNNEDPIEYGQPLFKIKEV